jgi:protein-S-isoprenylcysteine O-methyltransferase Ste14
MKRLAVPAEVDAGGAVGMDISVLDQRARQASAPDAADLTARFVLVVLFTLLTIRIAGDFLETGRLTGLLLLGSETLVVVLTVLRRSSSIVDRSPRARVLTTLSIMGPFLVRPAAAVALVPETATVLLSGIGLTVVIGGKLSLGRSFGLMPANRGIVSTGLYRVVRHPIYLGYLITHVGFFAANPTVWNAVILIGADLALMWRAVCEEQTLSLDPSYRAYQDMVRWRILPGVF